ncbi:MAG: Trm112 family protein [Cyanobacteriota bacterium]|nr:Trm112 family protein [Cyanobacteriota bacterium]
MFDREFLNILACPDTKKKVFFAESREISELNARILRGEVTNRANQKVETEITAGLIDEEGNSLYPIEEGIPMMLVDFAIPLK